VSGLFFYTVFFLKPALDFCGRFGRGVTDKFFVGDRPLHQRGFELFSPSLRPFPPFACGCLRPPRDFFFFFFRRFEDLALIVFFLDRFIPFFFLQLVSPPSSRSRFRGLFVGLDAIILSCFPFQHLASVRSCIGLPNLCTSDFWVFRPSEKGFHGVLVFFFPPNLFLCLLSLLALIHAGRIQFLPKALFLGICLLCFLAWTGVPRARYFPVLFLLTIVHANHFECDVEKIVVFPREAYPRFW